MSHHQLGDEGNQEEESKSTPQVADLETQHVHSDKPTETFISQHDVAFIRMPLMQRNLSLKHFRSIELNTDNSTSFDQLCQFLNLDFGQKLQFRVALEEQQEQDRIALQEKQQQDRFNKQFQLKRQKYIVTQTDEKYLYLYDQYMRKFLGTTTVNCNKNTMSTNYNHNHNYNYNQETQTFVTQSTEFYTQQPQQIHDDNTRKETNTFNADGMMTDLDAIIVGESGTGKTTMLLKMAKKNFVFNEEKAQSSIGIDSTTIMVDIGSSTQMTSDYISNCNSKYNCKTSASYSSKSGSPSNCNINGCLNLKVEATMDTIAANDYVINCDDINDNKEFSNINLVRLTLWDSAGQERFRNMVLNRNTFRNKNAIVLCYDISDESSFNKLETWYNNVMEIVDQNQVAVLVVGCKKDKGSTSDSYSYNSNNNRKKNNNINTNEGGRYVVADRAKQYADSIGASWSDCSAKTGEGIIETLLLIGKRAYKRAKWMEQQTLNDSGRIELHFFPKRIEKKPACQCG